jgi:hypothetical protein
MSKKIKKNRHTLFVLIYVESNYKDQEWSPFARQNRRPVRAQEARSEQCYRLQAIVPNRRLHQTTAHSLHVHV